MGRLPNRNKDSVEMSEGPLPEQRSPAAETYGQILIQSAADTLAARKAGRAAAVEAGFNDSEVTSIVTSISEVAQNIVEYAHSGEVIIKRIQQGARRGIEIIACDRGPGIGDVRAVMQPVYSWTPGTGMGLSRAKWLMDSFEIKSKVGRGTTITMVKWRTRD
jgi:serine/threonine-protein kinase RsbT